MEYFEYKNSRASASLCGRTKLEQPSHSFIENKSLRLKSASVSVCYNNHANEALSSTNGSGSLLPDISSNPHILQQSPTSEMLKLDKHDSNLEKNLPYDLNLSQKIINNLKSWLLCVAVIDFDENTGPTISKVYPNVDFNTRDEKSIKFSAIPDSTINQHCDLLYSYRFCSTSQLFDKKNSTEFLNSYVFFRQRADPLKKRGGMHKSIAIITPLCFHGLFIRLIETLGLLYFEIGEIAIETAFYNIAQWPLPKDGQQLTLPFLGTVYQAELPISNNAQIIEHSSFNIKDFAPTTHILAASVPHTLIFNFQSELKELWKLWEIVISAESLVVFADSPTKSFEVVTALVDLISPIKYCGDFRPYFTVQDPDYASIVSPKHIPPNTILGVTNPFFNYALSHWSNRLVLKSASRIKKVGSNDQSILSSQSKSFYGDIFSNSSLKSLKKTQDPSKKKNNLFTSLSKNRVQVTPNTNLINHLLENIQSGLQPSWVLNNTLQRYFYNLTLQFLVPFDRYFSTLVPQICSEFINVKSISDYNYAHIHTSPPTLGQWKNDDFFLSLEEHGIPAELLGKNLPAKKSASFFTSNIFNSSNHENNVSNFKNSKYNDLKFKNESFSKNYTFKNDTKSNWPHCLPVTNSWRDFYKKFTRCGNFATWLSKKTHETQIEIWKKYFASIAKYNIDSWVFDKRSLLLKKTNISESMSLFSPTINTNLRGAETTEKLFFAFSSPNPDLATNDDDNNFETIDISQKVFYNFENKPATILSSGSNKLKPNSNIKKKALYLTKDNSPKIHQTFSKPLIYDINATSKNKSASNLNRLIDDVKSQESSHVAILGSRGSLVGYINKKCNSTSNYNIPQSYNNSPNINYTNESRVSTSTSACVSMSGSTFSPKPGYNTDYTADSNPSSVNSSLTDLSLGIYSTKNEKLFGIRSPYEFGATFGSPISIERKCFSEEQQCQRSLEELCDMANFLMFILCVPIYFDNINDKPHVCNGYEGKKKFSSDSNFSSVEYCRQKNQSDKGTFENSSSSLVNRISDGVKQYQESVKNPAKKSEVDKNYKPQFNIEDSSQHKKWVQRIPSQECLKKEHFDQILIYKTKKNLKNPSFDGIKENISLLSKERLAGGYPYS
ncbi:hypothetical protein BB561_002332 [Smittium simulii]|uniref:UDENN domain-containing protein n=1 Tax=Smittium simulii TaxID=133385 RepID=A0A2T9YQX1_9FUNG|nr:hypothetical protein BB561_002332 [Smittium simulii]